MKNIGELLRETDPLRFESTSWMEQQQCQRQELFRAASAAGIETSPRSRVPTLAIVTIVLVALVSWIGLQVVFVDMVRAAVHFEVRLAEENPGPELIEAKVGGSSRVIYLRKEIIVANSDIEEASVIQDKSNPQYGVLVKLNAAGAEKMRAGTEGNIGKRLAIIIDGKVAEALTIRTPIGSSAVISGAFTKAQAERIAKGISEK